MGQDYAPSTRVVGALRLYLNISQEGKSCIDDLREMGLLNSLTLSSIEYQSIRAYQISTEGEAALENLLTPRMKEEVDGVLYAPGAKTGYSDVPPTATTSAPGSVVLFNTDPMSDHLLEVFWIEEKKFFKLLSGNGYERRSAVTDVEDVSYVCSPYIPLCVCAGDNRKKLQSNAFLAKEAVSMFSDPVKARSFMTTTGIGHNVRDKLEELITASEVKIIVAEWIPFGANQIRNLNQRLGSTNRVTGGLFTAIIDTMPTTTTFMHKVTNIGNLISIVDYTTCGHINFSADVYFEESPGILQIEEFGVHVEHSGMILYGVEVESIMDRLKEKLSLDHLARLLVDIHQDSSLIAMNLLNNYQRNLLDTLYNGSANSRPKYNVIVCTFLSYLAWDR